MKRFSFFLLLPIFFLSCSGVEHSTTHTDKALQQQIRENESYRIVEAMAEELVQSGYTAGDGYGEVWIRDFNTFIELSLQVNDPQEVKERLQLIFHYQGEDGNIIDGYIPRENATGGYKYIFSESAPKYAGHKNTVETDQETSLIQAVCSYIRVTNDDAMLMEVINGKTVLKRMEMALEFLYAHRWAEEHELIWGATTVDWGDVQPEHVWGVELDENSHLTIDIYDNAMLSIAIQDLRSVAVHTNLNSRLWGQRLQYLHESIREHLWDNERMMFVTNIYLDGSPFPDDFDENEIYNFGGTAVAIQAGILEPDEIRATYAEMRKRIERAGAASIGLTVEPPYPEGFFLNPSMGPGSYQNGGDWTWFGARMVSALVESGMVEEAVYELEPMIDRVIENDGFYEWYTVDNEPRGSGEFRGSAGVLWMAIQGLRN